MMGVVKVAVGVTFLVVVVYLGFGFATDPTLSFLGFGASTATSSGSQPRFWEVGLSALSMIVGLFFGALYEILKGRQGPVSVLTEIKGMLQSAAFFRALLVSPLVFAGVYAASQTQPDLVVALIFAFQNGFFCESIFREKH